MPPDLDLTDAAVACDLLDRAAAAMLGSTYRVHSVDRLPARGRLLVTGDLHDNPRHLQKLLAMARLAAAPDHHLVLHELIHGEWLINGMDFSHRMLLRVAELVLDHPGQVHPLLANHELAQMMGTPVSKGAGNSVAQFDDAMQFVYGESWTEVRDAIGRFIRAMPLAAFSESGLCCAHSLPSARAMERFDLEIIDRDPAAEDYTGPHGSVYMLVWGRRYTEESVERIAAAWGVKLFCVGHEHVEEGIAVRGRRVVVLNTDHENARALWIDLADLPPAEITPMLATPLRGMGEPGG